MFSFCSKQYFPDVRNEVSGFGYVNRQNVPPPEAANRIFGGRGQTLGRN